MIESPASGLLMSDSAKRANPTAEYIERRGYGRRWTDKPHDPMIHLLGQIPDGIMCFDREWRITYANPEARRICRITPADFNRRTQWELFPATIGSHLERSYRAAMEAGVSSHFEYYYPPYDNWLDLHVFPTEEGIASYYRDITDRKGAEYLRDAANRQLRQVLEATTDAVASINRDGNFTFLNRRAKELLAIKGDLLGKNMWDEFPAGTAQGAYLFNRAMNDGLAVEFEEFYPEPLNLWLSIQIRPSDDGVVIFFRDITTRQQANLTLIQQQELLTAVQQTARVATWDIDLSTGNVTFGPGSYPVFGHPLADIPNLQAFTKFVLPEYIPIVSNLIKKTVETGEMIVVDFPLLAADSSQLWVECRGQAVKVDGIPTRLRGLTIDITDRKRNEDALRTSEARYRILADLNPQAIWMGSPDGRFTYANQGLLDYLGVTIDIDDRKTFAETLQQRQEETERQRAELETIYETAPVGLALFDPVEFRYLRVNGRQAETIGLPKDQIIGRPITAIAPLKGLEELFQQVAAGHPIRNHVLEGEIPSRPGELRTWNVSYSPICSTDGKVEAIAAVVLEITNQKKAETALIQSEKLAAVGRLASSISHEINNPLEAITNLLYLVATSGHLPPDLAGYINTAQSELSRVCQIATQTLRFHRQAVRATNVTAEELVSAVLNLYQGRLANSSILVEATYETSSTILCFENDIRQVLNNLIANSIDAMRQGGRLVVRAHDATDYQGNRKGIRITIADTGHGMSPAVRARIFEPFYTTKDLNGTGLGLWISSGIVNRHQGRLTLRTTDHPIHHGTVFTLFLPYAEITEP